MQYVNQSCIDKIVNYQTNHPKVFYQWEYAKFRNNNDF